MRDNGPITDKELPLPENTLLVSQTDTKGRITFANDAFAAISGFSRDELIGAPHNLVRHPHMPAAAFQDLWATVKAGQPWEGLVKNRTKIGDYLLAEIDGQGVGTATSLSMNMWVRGSRIPSQGVAFVGVIRTARRGGVAKQLMEASLAKAREVPR